MSSTPTLAELASEYYRSRSLRPATVYSYNQSVKAAVRLLGDRPIIEYTADNITTFRDELGREGRKDHTVARILRELSALFEFARREREYVSFNVIEDLKIAPPAAPPEPFSEDELKTFFDFAWESDRPVYYQTMFLLLTGCRSNESCVLTLAQVDPGAEELDCRSEQCGRLESVPITPLLRLFLKEIPHYYDPYAFHYRNVHALYRAVKKIIYACGIRNHLTVRSFRETLETTSQHAGIKKNILSILIQQPPADASNDQRRLWESRIKQQRKDALNLVHTHLFRGLQIRNGFGREVSMSS